MSPKKERVTELRRRLDEYRTTISQSFLVEIKVDTGAVKGDVNLIKADVVELSVSMRECRARFFFFGAARVASISRS